MRFFSLKFSLWVLLILGGIAAIGTLIPQGQPPSFYPAQYGAFWGQLILGLSLDHLYRSWWLAAGAGILALGLLICPLRRWKPGLGLKAWGLLILHLGALVLLVGAAISFTAAKNATVELGVGDRVNLAAQGFPNLTLTLMDFQIQYYPNFQPQQYTSTIKLEGAGGQVRQGEAAVNYPLKFQGVKVYQSRWGWLVKGQVGMEGKVIPFEVQSGQPVALDAKRSLYLVPQLVPDLNTNSPVANNPGLFCRLLVGHELIGQEVIKPGETKNLGGYQVSFGGYRYLSGLEVKRDPGLPVVYAGFGLLLLGLILPRLRRPGIRAPSK